MMGNGIVGAQAASQFMTPGNNSFEANSADTSGLGADYAGSRMLQEYQNEIARLRHQNNQMMYMSEVREKEYENVMFENQTLYNKLENLENVFIGQPSRRSNAETTSLPQEYAESTI